MMPMGLIFVVFGAIWLSGVAAVTSASGPARLPRFLRSDEAARQKYVARYRRIGMSFGGFFIVLGTVLVALDRFS